MNRMNKIILCGLLLCLLGAAGKGYGQEVERVHNVILDDWDLIRPPDAYKIDSNDFGHIIYSKIDEGIQSLYYINNIYENYTNPIRLDITQPRQYFSDQQILVDASGNIHIAYIKVQYSNDDEYRWVDDNINYKVIGNQGDLLDDKIIDYPTLYHAQSLRVRLDKNGRTHMVFRASDEYDETGRNENYNLYYTSNKLDSFLSYNQINSNYLRFSGHVAFEIVDEKMHIYSFHKGANNLQDLGYWYGKGFPFEFELFDSNSTEDPPPQMMNLSSTLNSLGHVHVVYRKGGIFHTDNSSGILLSQKAFLRWIIPGVKGLLLQ